MQQNTNVGTPPAAMQQTAEAFNLAGHRVTGWLIKVSLYAGVAWFAYQLAMQTYPARHTMRESPVATIAILALSLTVAAYAAIRQQAHLAEQTRARRAQHLGTEAEKAGLLCAVEAACDAVVIADSDGTIQYVNPAFTRMTGYGSGEVIGRNPRLEKPERWMGPALHKQVRDAVHAGKTWRGESANRRKDGSLYDEELTVAAVRDEGGGIRKYVAVRRDISDRRSADETRSFLASIVESTEDAIISSTTQGTIVTWNQGAERLFGYTVNEVAGEPVSMLAPADQRASLKSIADTLRRGESVTQFECIGLTKAGRRLNISISACPVADADGQVTAWAAIIRDITARVQAQEARAWLASIVDSADDAIFGLSPDGAILSWNRGAEAMYGYTTGEILGKAFSILLPSATTGESVAMLDRIRSGESISQFETVTVQRDGQPVDVCLTLSPVRNAAGAVVGASAIARDITSRRQDREALERSEERYRTLIANLPDVVLVADEAGQPVFCTPNCVGVSGYTRQEVCSPGLWISRIHPEDLPEVESAYRALFAQGQAIDVEYRFLRKDEKWIWLHSRAVSTHAREGRRYRDELLSDITARKRMEQKLAHQATHDLLTGLPNRLVFEDRFQQVVARARRQGGMAALLYLDLDRFKRINGTLGHTAGDTLIRLAAERLSGCLRESETLSRMSGDRFAVLLGDLGAPQDAGHAADRILKALSAPFSVKGNEVFLTGSIGISFYPQDGEELLTLQRAADCALQTAKRQGTRRVQMSPEISRAEGRRLALETELHYALERGELSVHYQPQFDLATNRISGLEALVRWHNPKFGMVPPAVLIPIAEESGLIVPIGAFVLREACRQGKLWREAGYAPVKLAVNTSAVQFTRGDLVETVAGVLAETGLEPSYLDLEVTESIIIQDIQETARQLKELKMLGVTVSLDDFGTGYSSLSYLEELPIDNLKIDRKFVQRMNGTEATRTLVQSIVGLAHSLGMRAVAEGVETGEQLEHLKAMGCDRAQSFLLAGPAPALCIQALLMQPAGSAPPASPAVNGGPWLAADDGAAAIQ